MMVHKLLQPDETAYKWAIVTNLLDVHDFLDRWFDGRVHDSATDVPNDEEVESWAKIYKCGRGV